MNITGKQVTWAVAAVLLATSLYLFRTVELGRNDGQPVLLDILNPRGELVGPGGIQFDTSGNL